MWTMTIEAVIYPTIWLVGFAGGWFAARRRYLAMKRCIFCNRVGPVQDIGLCSQGMCPHIKKPA